MITEAFLCIYVVLRHIHWLTQAKNSRKDEEGIIQSTIYPPVYYIPQAESKPAEFPFHAQSSSQSEKNAKQSFQNSRHHVLQPFFFPTTYAPIANSRQIISDTPPLCHTEQNQNQRDLSSLPEGSRI